MPVMLLLACLILLYTFQSLFTKLFSLNYAGKDKGISTSVFSVCYGGFIGLATFAINGFSYTFAWPTLAMGLCNALVLWLYNTSLIQAGNRGSYAFLMICNLFGGIIVPMVIGLLFMGETLSVLQLCAIGLMLVAFVVMNARGISFKGASGAYYLWCALLFLANGSYATFMNLHESTMGQSFNGEMIVTVFLGMAVIVVLSHVLRGNGKPLAEGFRMGKRAALFALGSACVATLAANLCLYLLGQVQASVLFTIDNGGVLVMSALFSCLFFKEKLRWEQIVGIVLAVISIAMIQG